jgi:hypothetical protein
MKRPRLLLASFLLAVGTLSSASEDRIAPWEQNPRFWQYQGKPVFLLGGSKDDNLFQIPDLEAHLRAMAAAGANYIRNTMSDRQERDYEVYPYKQLPDGRYDLKQWNPEYWQRFDNLLRWTHELGIIVQIEIWDRFDHARTHWTPSPYNPKNNVNYTYEESGFVGEYPDHPGRNQQPFFFTTPKQRNNTVVLPYQQRFVDEVLRRTLAYPHVLYCMDNETSGENAWSVYWAEYVQTRAREAGATVHLTEMWDAHDLKSDQHKRTFDHPERYAFVDVSQNNHKVGDEHWNNLQWVHAYLANRPRPVNTVKTYGAEGGTHGNTDTIGLERWWRSVLGGVASARFHRPPSGLGFSPKAEAAIRSARLVETRVPFWELRPALDRLRDREPNEAFATVQPGRALVVYFTKGGNIEADLKGFPAHCDVRWIDLAKAEWKTTATAQGGGWTRLTAPTEGAWIALIEAR